MSKRRKVTQREECVCFFQGSTLLPTMAEVEQMMKDVTEKWLAQEMKTDRFQRLVWMWAFPHHFQDVWGPVKVHLYSFGFGGLSFQFHYTTRGLRLTNIDYPYYVTCDGRQLGDALFTAFPRWCATELAASTKQLEKARQRACAFLRNSFVRDLRDKWQHTLDRVATLLTLKRIPVKRYRSYISNASLVSCTFQDGEYVFKVKTEDTKAQVKLALDTDRHNKKKTWLIAWSEVNVKTERLQKRRTAFLTLQQSLPRDVVYLIMAFSFSEGSRLTGKSHPFVKMVEENVLHEIV